MQHVLVKGATGFVGATLCRTLEKSGCRVRRAVRRLETVDQEGLDQARLIGEIGPETDWRAALRDVDCIVHLAARVHVMKERSEAPLAEFRRINVAGTEHLAREAASCGVRRLVFLSSVKVNGEATAGKPYSEDDEPQPQDPYGISKWEAEQALRRVARETGLEVVVIRAPLVYGPGVKGNFLAMINVLRRGIPLPLGGIENQRSLIYVENLVDAIMLTSTHPLAAGQTFLVRDGEDVSTPTLLRAMAAALDVPARVFSVPPAWLRFCAKLAGRSQAVDRLLGSLSVDDSKIRRMLGWHPPFSLVEGLAKTASSFKGA